MDAYCSMLECSDGSYYVGSTTNLEKRVGQHQAGLGSAYTRRRLPVRLVWCEQFSRADDAFRREKQVQNWSRAKREALIARDYDALPALSRNYTEFGPPESGVSTGSTSGIRRGR
ncbi:MAG TPA: GIY-YIG nuclease family protein [Nocardioides sp.]|nr:GIY-YIG nuclease family protein [Nocardioides sp.]